MEKIISRKNSKLVHAKKLGADRSYREQYGEFLCDGRKLLEEAVRSGMEIVSVFAVLPNGTALSTPFLEPTGDSLAQGSKTGVLSTVPDYAGLYEIDNDVLDSISPLKNPQDVLFICRIPEPPTIDCTRGTHILLDNVQDPGNVGTIIRSADAFGIESIILTEGCADPYNPKAIRASMGAVFRQKLAFMSLEQLQDINARLIGTASNNEFVPVNEANLKNAIVVLGNEGQGISQEIWRLCEDMISIPIANDCESLNVAIAASIIMWEAGKLGVRS